MSGVLECRRDSPVRPPDWRWKAAQLAYDDGNAVDRRFRDDWLMRAYRLHSIKGRAIKKGKTETQWISEVFSVEGPIGLDILDAYTIHRQVTSPRAAEIDARLLARQSIGEIAERMVIPDGTIAAYEAMFFNVLDKLAQPNHESWVNGCVLGQAFHNGVTPRDWQLLWKIYGYYGGPFILETVIRKSGLVWANNEAQVRHGLAADRMQMLMLKDALAARTLNINTFTEVPILEVALKDAEFRHKLAMGATDEMADSLQKILASFVHKLLDGDAAPRKFEPRTIGLLGSGEEVIIEPTWTEDPFKRQPTVKPEKK